jgi:DNA polymerase-3 subunit delta
VPALDISALRAQLTSGRLAPVYVFVGEDLKLVDRMVDGIEATIDPGDRPFAVERLFAGEPGGSPIDIAAASRAYPMLGDRRVVFVMRAERLLKPKRASKAAEAEESDVGVSAEEGGCDLEPLEEYLGSPAPSTVLVFVATEIDRSRRFTKRLMEKAQVVVFSGLGDATAAGRRDGRADAAALVRDEMARAGRAIDPAALKELVARCGTDITKLRGDLERLLLYTEGQQGIAVEDVREISSVDVSVEDDWALVTAVGEGDCARALREAARRLDRGDSAHAVVGQLRWWVSVRLAEAAPARVWAATEALLRTDLALKSSGGDERVLIERLVVDLSGAPIPRRGWR